MNNLTEWTLSIGMPLAAVIDLHSRRIPNWLTMPLLIAGLAASGARGGWAGIVAAAGGMLIGILLTAPFCVLGGMGMGDLKLCAAAGVWLGPPQMVFAMLLTAMAGGLVALIYLLAARLSTGASGNQRGKQFIPYAPAISIGVLFALFSN